MTFLREGEKKTGGLTTSLSANTVPPTEGESVLKPRVEHLAMANVYEADEDIRFVPTVNLLVRPWRRPWCNLFVPQACSEVPLFRRSTLTIAVAF